jgi:type I restriction enzyme M protein
MNEMLEKDYEDHGRKALAPLLAAARQAADVAITQQVERLLAPLIALAAEPLPTAPQAWNEQVRAIVREFAKLDGYDVRLRSHAVRPVERDSEAAAPEPKCWTAAVRAYVRNPDWRDADETVEGSHDEDGNVRREYIDFLVQEKEAFEPDGAIKSDFLDLLDPDCIEANDFNLSAGRYRPLSLSTASHRPPQEIILRLQALETEIQGGLAELLAMVEDEE